MFCAALVMAEPSVVVIAGEVVGAGAGDAIAEGSWIDVPLVLEWAPPSAAASRPQQSSDLPMNGHPSSYHLLRHLGLAPAGEPGLAPSSSTQSSPVRDEKGPMTT